MYKAAINFDVFRTQMFCPVAYCKQSSAFMMFFFSSQTEFGDGGGRILYRGELSRDVEERRRRDVQKGFEQGRPWTILDVHRGILLPSPV